MEENNTRNEMDELYDYLVIPDYEKAEELLLQMMDAIPCFDYSIILYLLYCYTNRLPLALACINRDIEKFPDVGQLYSARASFEIVNGDLDEAIKDWQQASKLGFKNQRDCVCLAMSYFYKHQFKKALNTLEEAGKMESKDFDCSNQIRLWKGRTLMAMGKESEGKEELEICAHMPDNVSVEDAEALALLGRKEECWSRLNDVIDNMPEDTSFVRIMIYLDAAALYATIGVPARATTCLEEAFALGFNIEYLFTYYHYDPESFDAIMGLPIVLRILHPEQTTEPEPTETFTLADMDDDNKFFTIANAVISKVQEGLAQLVTQAGFKLEDGAFLVPVPNIFAPHFQHFCLRVGQVVYSMKFYLYDRHSMERAFTEIQDEELLEEARKNNMIPCVIGVDVNAQDMPQLFHMETNEPINFADAHNAEPTVMSPWEIHHAAIHHVVKYLQGIGLIEGQDYTSCDSLSVQPQITFNTEEKDNFVIVYGHTPGIKDVPPIPHRAKELLEEGREGYFANVSVSSFWNNGNFDETEEYRGAPLAFGIEGQDEYPILMPIEEAMEKYGLT